MQSVENGHVYAEISLTLRRLDLEKSNGPHMRRYRGAPRTRSPNDGVTVESTMTCRSSLRRIPRGPDDVAAGAPASAAAADGDDDDDASRDTPPHSLSSMVGDDVYLVGYLAHEVLKAVGLYHTRNMRRGSNSSRRLTYALRNASGRMGMDTDACFPRSRIQDPNAPSGRGNSRSPFSRMLPLEYVPRFLCSLSGSAQATNNPILTMNDLVNRVSTEYIRWPRDGALYEAYQNLCINWRHEIEQIHAVHMSVPSICDTLDILSESYDNLTSTAAKMNAEADALRETLEMSRRENRAMRRHIKRSRAERRRLKRRLRGDAPDARARKRRRAEWNDSSDLSSDSDSP